ncbi:phage terminase small subunit P27 family [Moraxella pluranimalium]|uniref:Terminase n=1 Tax=Moraxella pluranimalium TaxID=470453 RepID=A0A1T0CPQ6_9GAMM|nr:phage terminase small subunit P27 family [Moraxella pluranimalium]OOS24239.1 terminase [Moraxella pluranimalium]
MARPRKPTQLKVLEGGRIRGDRDALDNQARPEIALPACPDWLDAKARKIWHKIGPELVNLGLLSVIDGDIFGSYAETAARYGEVCERIDTLEKCMAITPNGFEVQSVLFQLRNTLQKQLVALGREFGMTPAARSSIKVNTDQGDLFANEFDQFTKIS